MQLSGQGLPGVRELLGSILRHTCTNVSQTKQDKQYENEQHTANQWVKEETQGKLENDFGMKYSENSVPNPGTAEKIPGVGFSAANPRLHEICSQGPAVLHPEKVYPKPQLAEEK